MKFDGTLCVIQPISLGLISDLYAHRSQENKGMPFGGETVLLGPASLLSSITHFTYVSSSEGVQIGGLRSSFGVLGAWTTIFHDSDDPVGELWLQLIR